MPQTPETKKDQFVDPYRREINTDDETYERSLTCDADRRNYQMNSKKFDSKRTIFRKQLKKKQSLIEYNKIKAKMKSET